jgi:hypothetical protein
MKTRTLKKTIIAATLAVALNHTALWAGVIGKALLTDAPSRIKPDNLFLCFVNGEERRMEKLAVGPVIDAHFSPDGMRVVYGVDGMIKVMPPQGSRQRSNRIAEHWRTES